MKSRRHSSISRRATACLVAMLAAAAAMPANAVENGGTITPFGFADFGAGMLPPPSPNGSIGLGAAYYTANSSKDGQGRTDQTNFSITVRTLGLAYLRMTDIKVLGANFGMGAVFSLIDIKGSVTPPGFATLANSDLAFGDMQILPIMLQWQLTPNFFANAILQIQAPTGAYNVNQAFNAGVNHWSIAPVIGLTYISDSGFEASSRIELNFNMKNPATGYTSGVEYKHEFALGQHVGPWVAGIGGYFYQQVTDDTGPTVTDGYRGRTVALGPALRFVQAGLPVVSIHAYREFGVANRSEGYNAAIRVGLSF